LHEVLYKAKRGKVMLAAIIIYIILLVIVGICDFFKIKDFKDYAVAGKNQGFGRVFLSLMATMIGASATIGVADRVVEIGFPAFWWLGVGAVGLILQAFILSEKIRALDANTLPDVASKTVGEGARKLLALIIAVSWVGIIAAQFVSVAKIIMLVLPDTNRYIVLLIIAVFVIAYTIIGGQMSVIKTDNIQAWLIAIGVIITFIYVFVADSSGNSEIFASIELTNDEFKITDLINLFFITGGAYFLGPDIVSRNLISKDGKTAKKAAIASSVALFVFSIIITLTSMWTVENIPTKELNGQNPLLYIMDNYVPYPIAILLCLSLIATLVSSADTCMINAASIIEYDLLKRDKVKEIRVIVCALGIISLCIALFSNNIIGLLMSAYSVYVPGIVIPLLFGILCYKKRNINKKLWYIAVIIGGGFGLLNSYFGIGTDFLPLVGMGVSLLFSVLAVTLNTKY